MRRGILNIGAIMALSALSVAGGPLVVVSEDRDAMTPLRQTRREAPKPKPATVKTRDGRDRPITAGDVAAVSDAAAKRTRKAEKRLRDFERTNNGR